MSALQLDAFELPRTRLPGLTEMLATAFPWECPFCGDVKTKTRGPGRIPVTCGDPVCRIAWHRCWKRDYVRGIRRRAQ